MEQRRATLTLFPQSPPPRRYMISYIITWRSPLKENHRDACGELR
ncbi:MAG: hypothetical protein V7K47_13535 [Nostoc sp.]